MSPYGDIINVARQMKSFSHWRLAEESEAVYDGRLRDGEVEICLVTGCGPARTHARALGFEPVTSFC
jgi:hypothetical protein